jgi:phosphoglycolate phosphatase-like HAD superfamily hydrolase
VLILLDIDGTLLHGAPRAHTEAMVRALADVYGVPAAAEDVAAVVPAGRTDQEIARLVLARHGVADGRITAGLPAFMARAAALYPEADACLPAPVVASGAGTALARLRAAGASLALLTGNLEPIARAKMARAGLAGWFREGQGAFGSDHERRDALVPIAVRRAARNGSAAAEPVVVGDTPRDIACARAGGARCVAVATGVHRAEELAAADAVVHDLAAAADVLTGWLPTARGPR